LLWAFGQRGAGAQPAGKRLAVHATKLALEPRLKSYDDILAHCCAAWNKLVDQSDVCTSIGMRRWAHVGVGQPL
jgi:hypothetical protein